jgi:hypothetical protein
MIRKEEVRILHNVARETSLEDIHLQEEEERITLRWILGK